MEAAAFAVATWGAASQTAVACLAAMVRAFPVDDILAAAIPAVRAFPAGEGA